MARPIEVSIPHALGKEEARRRIEGGFSNVRSQMTGGLAGMLSFQERWESDRLEFEGGALGQNMRGRLEILDDSVRLQVELPEMLAGLADRVIGTLKKGTQKLLANE